MRRLLGIPVVEQSSYMIVTQLERLVSIGGMAPLAIAALLAYLLVVGQQRGAHA